MRQSDFFVNGTQGGGLQHDKLEFNKTGVINKISTLVLVVTPPFPTLPPPPSTLETYRKSPIFILVVIMEDVVELIVQKLLGGLGSGGKDSEVLRGGEIRGVHTMTSY